MIAKPKQAKHTRYNIMYEEVVQELVKAHKKFPLWPVCPIHGTAIVIEEAGEAMQAALDYRFGRCGVEPLRKELIQTAAMCFRMLGFIDKHHPQEATDAPD